jgi:hypothetical protein
MTDKEIAAIKHRVWREANPGRHLASVVKWQKANPEKVKAYRRAYYLKCRALIAKAKAIQSNNA